MDGSKRFTGGKNNNAYNGRLKEILLSKQKSEEKITEADIANIPIIKQADNSRLLPKYSSILGKSGEDGVSMEDLDQLQADLEKLLTTNAARIRHLLAEIGELDRNEEGHGRKAYDKTSLKRKRNDDTSRKFKDTKNGMRVIKKQYGLTHKFVGDTHLQEVPKVTLPKNDNSDKFWASIEPYCANVSKDDVAFLESLIQECAKDINMNIPELGEHYTEGWSDEILNEEQNYGKSPSKKISGFDMKRNKLHAIMDTFATPLNQNITATIEENIMSVLPKTSGPNGIIKFKACDVLKSSNNNHKLGACLDKKLKKEQVEQGILTLDDLAKTQPDDEILTEIKKCQLELKTMNKYNIEELNKLKTIVTDDLRCSDVKDQLEKVDKQVLDLYNKILVARKAAQTQDGDEFDRNVFNEQITKEFEGQADALLKQQIALNNENNGMTEMHMLY
ncbi:unnamed protein product [Acanthoscelides obtectus]|uniref:Uncharacterized protein n=1 Tax=Acanthoscelides obtectus TaxID=200917 RepID=A0A9P0P4G6_ACAOB|nr:unnamed protein product [Acanthoscelides obtectus]CAK1629071.1 Transcriptional adapter 3-B [Acanthoscelides obtectus]